ncbi:MULTISPECIES: SIS domain-containing protein [Clostridia]|uniref:SIS domain-containing protein n=1 Tax=Clostridia TaxID=186801 RepID=UPI000EA0C9A5|nr:MULTISPECIES: SIS domain-containing protein [Clostridia]NBJ68850.1 SIS domain-containing protein [Roseburia sp. 1XD42-34]RKI80227.1 SIS domain-containing protein [Clostridium sp. 1xD42-85]
MFHLSKQALQKGLAGHTAQEIYQQPEVWKEALSTFEERKEEIYNFLNSIYINHEKVRVILTGAGTSAFAGDILVPELQKQDQGNIQFEAIATTDIVSNPTNHLFKDTPTILVSFARSGNSPESLAAVKLATDIIDHFYQVNITCNPQGKLAINTKNNENSITILTPEKAHDQGFAMTSSFTSMMVICYLVFSKDATSNEKLQTVIANGERLVEDLVSPIEEVLSHDMERIVYLGSGSLGQFAHEAALKMLELSAGKVVAVHESSLGFRHGPKSILNDKSIVVLFMSQDAYTRKYDMDMLKELSGEPKNIKTVVLTETADEEIKKYANWAVVVNSSKQLLGNDIYLSLLYALFAQTLALKKSIQLGISPDNPSPDGSVNRVVQGVTIYDFE